MKILGGYAAVSHPGFAYALVCVLAYTHPPTYRPCSNVEFMRSVWKPYATFTERSDSGRVFTYLIFALKRLVTSRLYQRLYPDAELQYSRK